MIDIDISVSENVTDMTQYLIDHEAAILDRIHQNIAFDLKMFMQDNYLKGGALKSRTGGLLKAVKYRKSRTGRGISLSVPAKFAVQETGALIMPTQKKVLKFVTAGGDVRFVRGPIRIPATHFFSRAVKAYQSTGRISLVAQRTINKILERGL